MKWSDNAEIIFSDNHLLVASKPAGWLTQPDGSDTPSLEEFAKEWVKKEYNKPGNVYLHAIHRLDKPVCGLVLFARTSKALSRLNELSRDQEIQRIYTAEVEGILPEKEGRLDHYLIHGEHKALIGNEKTGKHARLTYVVTHFGERNTQVSIELETGRYHQIRAQFGAIGHPIVGDKKYGAKSGDGESIRLACSKLSFKHPVTKEVLELSYS
jgi:23S rRNA pseudouridine1911/1915/1917 synthase